MKFHGRNPPRPHPCSDSSSHTFYLIPKCPPTFYIIFIKIDSPLHIIAFPLSLHSNLSLLYLSLPSSDSLAIFPDMLSGESPFDPFPQISPPEIVPTPSTVPHLCAYDREREREEGVPGVRFRLARDLIASTRSRQGHHASAVVIGHVYLKGEWGFVGSLERGEMGEGSSGLLRDRFLVVFSPFPSRARLVNSWDRVRTPTWLTVVWVVRAEGACISQNMDTEIQVFKAMKTRGGGNREGCRRGLEDQGVPICV